MRAVDVVVAGGGVAGTAAALAAAAAGARTVLVRRGPGVSALAGGGWIGAPPEAFATALAGAGLSLVGCGGALPHPRGVILTCDYAPASHALAGLGSGAEQALVCGIAGLPSFRASALARLWSAAAGLPERALESVTLMLEDTPPGGWSPVSLAALLEREPQRLAAPLAHAVRERGAARALVPAVLGLTEHSRTHAAVQHHAGVSVGEVLGVAPSIPGWRLDTALQQMVRAAAVEVVTGAATCSLDSGGGGTVDVAADGGAITFRASAVVLATGKFAGGGVLGDPAFRDSVAGIAVTLRHLGRSFADATETMALTAAQRLHRQPVLSAGLPTGDDGTLPATEGAADLRGVFVAGTLRSEVETGTYGLGHAALDGWNAGSNAAAAAAKR